MAFVIGDFLEPPVTDLLRYRMFFNESEGATTLRAPRHRAAAVFFRDAVLPAGFGLDNYCHGQSRTYSSRAIGRVDRLPRRRRLGRRNSERLFVVAREARRLLLLLSLNDPSSGYGRRRSDSASVRESGNLL